MTPEQFKRAQEEFAAAERNRQSVRALKIVGGLILFAIAMVILNVVITAANLRN